MGPGLFRMGFIYNKSNLKLPVCDVSNTVTYIEQTTKLPPTLRAVQDETLLIELARQDFNIPRWLTLNLTPRPDPVPTWRYGKVDLDAEGRYVGLSREWRVCVTHAAPPEQIMEFMLRENKTYLPVEAGLYAGGELAEGAKHTLNYTLGSNNLCLQYKRPDAITASSGGVAHPRLTLAPCKRRFEEMARTMHSCLSRALPSPARLNPEFDVPYGSQITTEHRVRDLLAFIGAIPRIPGSLTALRRCPEFKQQLKDLAARADMAYTRDVYRSQYGKLLPPAGAGWCESNTLEKLHRKIFNRSVAGRYNEEVQQWEKKYGRKKKKTGSRKKGKPTSKDRAKKGGTEACPKKADEQSQSTRVERVGADCTRGSCVESPCTRGHRQGGGGST